MSDWSLSELLQSTQYGKVYIITKLGHHVHTRRVRRNKDKKLLVTNEKHRFILSDDSHARVGTFMFIEKGGQYTQLLNPSDPVLAAEVDKAIKCLGGKA
jgi:hypothetical protein